MKLTSKEIENLVSTHHAKLYRFAFSLVRNEAEAADLTQQTYFKLASKGSQIRDASKAKSWLFTTLYREFLALKRHSNRFVSSDIDIDDDRLSAPIPVAIVEADAVSKADAGIVLDALSQVREIYRAPLALFYIDDLSYREIAAILDVPMGTVMSRLARGKEDLRTRLTPTLQARPSTNNVIPIRKANNE